MSNPNYSKRVLGKAGASRWVGRRPKVRGVAMNSVDHPMGGGEGKSSGAPCDRSWSDYVHVSTTEVKITSHVVGLHVNVSAAGVEISSQLLGLHVLDDIQQCCC